MAVAAAANFRTNAIDGLPSGPFLYGAPAAIYRSVMRTRMSHVCAADAFSRRPLPHGYRPFIGLTLKVGFGEGFGRRPLAGRSCGVRGRRSKASQGGNRGEEGGCLAGATYGDLRIAEERGRVARGPVARGVRRREATDGERVRSRGCAGWRGRGAWRGLATWRGRRASCSGARLEAKSERRCEAGSAATDHEVSILIRLGDGDRAGRAPSNVSTMIIRPPQQGQRRAGEDVFGRHCRPRRANAGARLGRGERLAGALDVARSNRAGEEAVVADAVEAARQHVQEKAADELAGVERHGLEPVAAFDAVVLTWGVPGQGVIR